MLAMLHCPSCAEPLTEITLDEIRDERNLLLATAYACDESADRTAYICTTRGCPDEAVALEVDR